MTYERIGFKKGDVLKASHLNHMEEGISYISSNMIDNLLPEFSESGAAVECHPFPLCPLDVSTTFEPAQAGSGDPYPAGGGKSLIPFKDLKGFNNTVFSAAVIDGQSVTTIDASTSDYTWAGCGTNNIRLPAAGTYTFSAYVYAPTAATCRLSILDSTYAGVAGAEQKLSAGWTRMYTTLTGASVNDEYMFIVRALTSDNVDISFNRCMVELGDVPTEYQPYSNIRPISGHESLRLTRCGKNLARPFKDATKNGLTLTNNPDSSVTLNGTATASGPFDSERFFLPVGTYTISIDKPKKYLYVSYDNENNLMLGKSDDLYKMTGQNVSDFGTMHMWIEKGITFDNFTFKLQLEPGSTATPFEPYQGDTYTVQLGDTVYGGTYDWSKGELMAEWVMTTLDESTPVFAWHPSAGSACVDQTNLFGDKTAIKCSHFKTLTERSGYANDVLGIFNNYQYNQIGFSNPAFKTVDDWTAFFAEQYAAGTPVQIAYKLAEPITIRLAPSEIMPLDGTNVLISNPGDTTVSGKLDLSYLHEENKTVKAKLADMEARLRALENA